jgi:hypothetical protein
MRHEQSAQYGASNRTSFGRFRPKSLYAQRRHDAASTVPSLRSVHPPSPPEVGRRRRRREGVSIRRRSRTCTPDRAGAHPGRRSAIALPLLSLSIPPSHWSGAGGTASDACRNAPSSASAKNLQQIALAGVTLAAAAVSAWSRYAPLLSLLCLGSAGCLSRRARRPHAITIALLTG